MIRTERLILRQWNDEDLLPFSQMCEDKDVMEFFPKLLTVEESYAMGEKSDHSLLSVGGGFGQLRFLAIASLLVLLVCTFPRKECLFHHVLRLAGVLRNDIGVWVTRR